jgi:hypothetical protein
MYVVKTSLLPRFAEMRIMCAMYLRRTTKKKDGTNYDCRLLLIFDEESSRFSAIFPEMLNFFIFFREKAFLGFFH